MCFLLSNLWLLHIVMGYPQFATRLCVSFLPLFLNTKSQFSITKPNYSHINSFSRSEISLINPMMEFLQVTSTSLQQVSLLFLFLREPIKYCNGSVFAISWVGWFYFCCIILKLPTVLWLASLIIYYLC